MKRILTVSMLTALAALWTMAVFAAVPQLINFQSILRDGSGIPVADSTYSVTFTIYNAASGGTNLWTETQSVTTANGLFAVLLGSANPVPDSAFNDSVRYLGVQVGADPEMTPRQQIVSTAYSFRVAHFIPNYGINNTFIGQYAGNLGMAGRNNTGSGIGALVRNNTGSENTANGTFALLNNNAGSSNTACGYSALAYNISGYNNTASGAEALANNTSGFYNTASGYRALYNNTTGSDNTASGVGALFSNTTGYSNTANGSGALYSNTTGIDNTASGDDALSRNTGGNGNTAYGVAALNSNTTGGANTASGKEALFNNTIGNHNTASGASALYSNTTGIDNTASGYLALGNNTTGSYNIASGFSALSGNTGGGGNTALGYGALSGNATGNLNTAIGYGANVAISTMTNATAIGANAIVDASDKIRLGNSAVTVLECQVGLTVVSDKNEKENFRPVDGEEVLEKLRKLELSSWNYKGHDPKQFRHYGPMAQDFFAAFGDDGVGKIGTETTLNSGDVAGILMAAVQALGDENAELKSRMEQLEKKLKELQAEKPQAEVR
ncbi:MAG TPA: tail fiber domain-containing protein [Verrucomicrobiae bacterium]|nr:tail fiber domain-containing protein [Verrucomicrobiae bacterium]